MPEDAHFDREKGVTLFHKGQIIGLDQENKAREIA